LEVDRNISPFTNPGIVNEVKLTKAQRLQLMFIFRERQDENGQGKMAQAL
jgi:hypothetical protein